ncbi:MAG: hypothetical protein QOE77_4243, partial [Blastocatellia bacterium]|nr:hypothetical protein [Blastocatellia bacterium]
MAGFEVIIEVEDIKSGDTTDAEAEPTKKEIEKR